MQHDRKLQDQAQLQTDGARADAFARELGELSQKHGIGITGEAILFVLDRDDASLAYRVDDESRLIPA